MYFRIFIYGLLAACLALILELILFGILPLGLFGFLIAPAPSGISLPLFIGLLLFVLIEEGARFLFLSRYAKNSSPLSSFPFARNTLLIVGLSFGLGFACLELLVGFLFGGLPQSGFLPGTLLLHILLSIGFAWLIFGHHSSPRALGILFSSAVIIHLGYNILILLS